MAVMGGGRKERFGRIQKLRPSEVEILRELFDWDYNSIKASSYNIASKLQISVNAVTKGLRYLNGRGLVRKGIGKSWHIVPSLKAELTNDFSDLISADSAVEKKTALKKDLKPIELKDL